MGKTTNKQVNKKTNIIHKWWFWVSIIAAIIVIIVAVVAISTSMKSSDEAKQREDDISALVSDAKYQMKKTLMEDTRWSALSWGCVVEELNDDIENYIRDNYDYLDLTSKNSLTSKEMNKIALAIDVEDLNAATKACDKYN